MKRIMSLFIAMIMLLGLYAIPVSASCGYGHGNEFLSYSCSGRKSQVLAPACHWAGHYGGEQYHGTDCQIVQTYRYTTETCNATGCAHSTQSGSHLCEADHTQADMYVKVCPYSDE